MGEREGGKIGEWVGGRVGGVTEWKGGRCGRVERKEVSEREEGGESRLIVPIRTSNRRLRLCVSGCPCLVVMGW